MNLTVPDRLEAILRSGIAGPALAIISFLVYLVTLAPGVYGFDSAELATGAYTLGIVHPPGFPLYLLLGKLFMYLPVGNAAFRLNLMSAVFASLTVLALYYLLLEITGRRLIAWVGAATAGFSYYFWQMAVVAEVYTLHTFLLVLALLFIMRWDRTGRRGFLFGFGLVYGLSLANHTSGLMFAPAFAWLIFTSPHWRWRDTRTIAYLTGVFLASLVLYLYLPIRAAQNPALNYVSAYYDVDLTTLSGIYWMVSAQAYRFFAFGYPLQEIPAEFITFVGYLWRNFMGAGVLLGIPGMVWMWMHRRRQMAAFGWIFGINTFFYINYRVLDKDTMFLPAYLIWSIWAAVGMYVIYTWISKLVQSGLLYPLFRPVYQAVLVCLVVLAVGLNWRWVNMREMTGPTDFAEDVMRRAEPGATIFAEWSPAVVLEYYQLVEKQRPDLTIYNRSRASVARFYHYWKQGIAPPVILAQLDKEEIHFLHEEIRYRPVYMVEYDPLFADDFEYLPQLTIFQLRLREEVQ